MNVLITIINESLYLYNNINTTTSHKQKSIVLEQGNNKFNKINIIFKQMENIPFELSFSFDSLGCNIDSHFILYCFFGKINSIIDIP